MNDIRICNCGTHIDADAGCNGENYGGYLNHDGPEGPQTTFVCDTCWPLHFEVGEYVEEGDQRITAYLSALEASPAD